MDFRVEHTYDCTPATLHAVLTDADHLAAKFRALGFRDIEVLTAEPGLVRTRRVLNVTLPAFASKMLGSRQSVEQDETWNVDGGTVRGTFHGRSTDTPVSLAGTIVIEPRGSGCLMDIRGEAEAKIPFVGGKVAALVAEQTVKNLDREYEFTRTWIKDHP